MLVNSSVPSSFSRLQIVLAARTGGGATASAPGFAPGTDPARSRTGEAPPAAEPPAPGSRFHSLPVGLMLVNSSVPSGRTRFHTDAGAEPPESSRARARAATTSERVDTAGRDRNM